MKHTILITRPKQQASTLKTALEKLGAYCIIEPMLEITYKKNIELSSKTIKKTTAVIITSHNALPACLSIIPKEKQIITVGKNTYANTQKLGFDNVTTANGNSDDLVKYIITHFPVKNSNFIYLAGKTTNGAITTKLQAHGFSVIEKTCYITKAVKKLSKSTINAIIENKINIVILLSAKSAENFAKLISNNKLQDKLANITAVVMSKNIAYHINHLPFKHIIESKKANLDAIITTIKTLIIKQA